MRYFFAPLFGLLLGVIICFIWMQTEWPAPPEQYTFCNIVGSGTLDSACDSWEKKHYVVSATSSFSYVFTPQASSRTINFISSDTTILKIDCLGQIILRGKLIATDVGVGAAVCHTN